MSFFSLNAKEFVFWYGIATIITVIFKNILGLFLNYLSARFTYEIFSFNSIRIYQRQIFLNKQIDKDDSSQILHDITFVSQTFSHSVLLPAFHFLNEITIVLVILILMLAYSAVWFIVLFLFLGLNLIIVYYTLKKKIKVTQDEINKCYPEFTKSIYDGLKGIIDIKMNNSYLFFLDRFRNVVKLFSKFQVKNYVLVQISSRYIETIVLSTVVVICLIMNILNSSTGELVTVFSILSIVAFRLLPSINRIMIAILAINGGYFSLIRLKELQVDDIKESIEANGIIIKEIPFDSMIKFDEVYFRYDSMRDILSKFNLSILKGQSIGIIGSSGVGKSTFLSLLLGFKPPSSGKILIDDVDLTHQSSISNGWRNKIGFVQQNVFLRSATIAENIAFGIPFEQIDNEKLWKSIKKAGLDMFVSSLIEKELTQVGEDGGQLSGGQRQRIGIARALYQEPEILILDEATSALDFKTEILILETIKELKETGITILIVTHRYSMLKFCDIAYEMEKDKPLKVIDIENYS